MNLKERLLNITKNIEFKKIILEKKITKDQIIDNLFLIEQIIEERKKFSELDTEVLPTISIGSDGFLYKVYEKSSSGLEKDFTKNIKTQHITKINTKIKIQDIEKTRERQTIIRMLEGIIKHPEKIKKGLYLYGEMGRGKTYISQALAIFFAKKNFSVGYVNVSELISYLKQSFGAKDSNVVSSTIKLLKEVEILFFDDVGAETVVEWFRDEIFIMILSTRMNNNMTTFFSSNYNWNQLEKIESKHNGYNRYKSLRLIERIKALSNSIKVEGGNYRY